MMIFSFQPLLVTIVNGDDGNDCETHYPLCPYGKKCTYGAKCKYFHIERRFQNTLSITESLQMKARLEKSKLQHQLSNPIIMPIATNTSKIFSQTSSKKKTETMFFFQPSIQQNRVQTIYECTMNSDNHLFRSIQWWSRVWLMMLVQLTNTV